MATTNTSYSFPAEHQDFLKEFQDLLKKYSRAAGRFSLADLGEGANAPAALGPSSAWECRRTEWGLVCRKVPV